MQRPRGLVPKLVRKFPYEGETVGQAKGRQLRMDAVETVGVGIEGSVETIPEHSKGARPHLEVGNASCFLAVCQCSHKLRHVYWFSGSDSLPPSFFLSFQEEFEKAMKWYESTLKLQPEFAPAKNRIRTIQCHLLLKKERRSP